MEESHRSTAPRRSNSLRYDKDKDRESAPISSENVELPLAHKHYRRITSSPGGGRAQIYGANASHASGLKPATILKLVLYALFGIPLVLYGWVVLLGERVTTSFVSPELLDAQRILWLTAHPDDESMFFAPSIFNLLGSHYTSGKTANAPTGHVLSLSAGNAEGLGATRTVEMRAACIALGITPDHCIVLDQETLPDNADIWWDESVIEYWTRTYIEKWKIDLIVTFDESGVSGHANHRAINAALTKAANLDLSFPKVYTLRTTRSVLSKYSSLFLYPYIRLSRRWRLSHPLPSITWDPNIHPIAHQKHPFLPAQPKLSMKQMQNGYDHPFSSHPSLLINSPWQYLKSRSAFKQHRSQVLWFRRLYMFVSRYMWFNELEKVVRIHERVVDLGKIREAQKDAL